MNQGSNIDSGQEKELSLDNLQVFLERPAEMPGHTDEQVQQEPTLIQKSHDEIESNDNSPTNIQQLNKNGGGLKKSSLIEDYSFESFKYDSCKLNQEQNSSSKRNSKKDRKNDDDIMVTDIEIKDQTVDEHRRLLSMKKQKSKSNPNVEEFVDFTQIEEDIRQKSPRYKTIAELNPRVGVTVKKPRPSGGLVARRKMLNIKGVPTLKSTSQLENISNMADDLFKLKNEQDPISFESHYYFDEPKKELGEGAHANIYRCYKKDDLDKSTPYAVKMIREDDDEKRLAHRKEYDITQSLDHQNIVKSHRYF